MKDRREDLPRHVKLVVTHKVRMVALEGVEDESFVRLGDLRIGKSLRVGHVELDRDGTCGKARQFGVHFHINRFVRLNPEDELVSGDIGEDALNGILVLNPDLDLALIQGCGMSALVVAMTHPCQPS